MSYLVKLLAKVVEGYVIPKATSAPRSAPVIAELTSIWAELPIGVSEGDIYRQSVICEYTVLTETLYGEQVEGSVVVRVDSLGIRSLDAEFPGGKLDSWAEGAPWWGDPNMPERPDASDWLRWLGQTLRSL